MEQVVGVKIAVFGKKKERCSEGWPKMCPKIAAIYTGEGGPQIGSRCSLFGGELKTDAQGYFVRCSECVAAVIEQKHNNHNEGK